MIGTYNVDFLIAGLALLLLISLHFYNQKKIDSVNTKIFSICLALSISDVMLDMLSTWLITRDNSSAVAGIARLSLTLFYLMQALFPYFVVYYTLTMRDTSMAIIRRDSILWGIIPMIMCVLIVVNYWAEILFGFDSMGQYYQGELYYLMYGYALLYVAAAIVVCILHGRELGRHTVMVVAEFVVLEASCSLIQVLTETYLLTGFGLSIGMVIFYISLHNPNAHIDSTTGVFDKANFVTWMREQIYQERRVHALMVYLINLQDINKIYGMSAGDELLLTASTMLEEGNPGVRIFRISGKRFLLAADSLEKYEACQKHVRELFSQGIELRQEKVEINVSLCGMVDCQTLKDVDVLLAYMEYMSGLESKTGLSALIQSNDKIMEGFLYEQEIVRFLDTAIEKDLFEVYYQPVYSIQLNRYVTLEALSRLRHPTLGYVPPDVFITLAEKNGKIPSIGELQFRKICAFLDQHRGLMDRILNVKANLSPYELLKYEHCRHLTDIIREHNLPFSWFQFEVTETVATEYTESLLRTIKELKELGIGFCLDDFGSGYANLNTVMNLPFSVIKMDRSLLTDVTTQPRAATFYRSTVGILQDMGYLIVAEGAETADEVKLLKEWNVNMIQGFYFSRPLCEDALLKTLGEA